MNTHSKWLIWEIFNKLYTKVWAGFRKSTGMRKYQQHVGAAMFPGPEGAQKGGGS